MENDRIAAHDPAVKAANRGGGHRRRGTPADRRENVSSSTRSATATKEASAPRRTSAFTSAGSHRACVVAPGLSLALTWAPLGLGRRRRGGRQDDFPAGDRPPRRARPRAAQHAFHDDVEFFWRQLTAMSIAFDPSNPEAWRWRIKSSEPRSVRTAGHDTSRPGPARLGARARLHDRHQVAARPLRKIPRPARPGRPSVSPASCPLPEGLP